MKAQITDSIDGHQWLSFLVYIKIYLKLIAKQVFLTYNHDSRPDFSGLILFFNVVWEIIILAIYSLP